MDVISTTREPASLAEKISALKSLKESTGWLDLLLPEINRLLADHLEKAIDPTAPATDRAEHIEAIPILRALAKFPDTETVKIQLQWKNKQKT